MSDNEKLYDLIKETFILLDDGDRRLFNQFNLTPPRFYALSHINEEPGLSSSRLSERLLCDKSNVTRIVKGLESKGYIQRQPHETDGRAIRLFLTEKGTAVLQQVQSAHSQFNKTRINSIDTHSQTKLRQHLTQLNSSLITALWERKIIPTHNGNGNND